MHTVHTMHFPSDGFHPATGLGQTNVSLLQNVNRDLTSPVAKALANSSVHVAYLDIGNPTKTKATNTRTSWWPQGKTGGGNPHRGRQTP